MSCPICALPVAPDMDFCPGCRVGLDFSSGAAAARCPTLGRGEVLFSWDFRTHAPPGCRSRDERWGQETASPHPDGVVHAGVTAATATLCDPGLRIRSGCVRLSYTSLSPHARVGVTVHNEPIQTAWVGHILDLSFGAQQLFLARLATGPSFTSQTELITRAVTTPYLPSVGQRAEIELRFDGGWLLAYLDERLALRAYDPVISLGRVGLRVGREPHGTGPQGPGPRGTEPSAPVVLHSLVVHDIAVAA